MIPAFSLSAYLRRKQYTTIQYKPTDTVQLVLQCFLRLTQQHTQDASADCQQGRTSALEARVNAKRRRCSKQQRPTPMQRMQVCRDSLVRLNDNGWNRSYHQRLFHEDFLACAPPHCWP